MGKYNVKPNMILDVKINRLTKKGDGYVRYKGFAIFVKGVDLGWKGKIKISRVYNTFAIAYPL